MTPFSVGDLAFMAFATLELVVLGDPVDAEGGPFCILWTSVLHSLEMGSGFSA